MVFRQPSSFAVIEHGLIRNARDFPDAHSSPTEVFVPDGVFQHLRQLATDTEGTDTLLTVFWQKGRETIRVRHYVGLIGLPNGSQLEILPGIVPAEAARFALLTMLRRVHGPFRTLTLARTRATQLPLWEVFVTAFLDALEPLVHQGMQRAYVSVERNERYLRGKFQAARQQRDNAHHAERLAVVYEYLTANCAPNRVLKTALLSIQPQSVGAACGQRIRQLRWALDEVPTSASVNDDLKKTRLNSRLFRHYEPALRWAEALLSGRAFGLQTGLFSTISILFSAQHLFEAYVAHAIRTHWPTGVVGVQESSAHLVDEHGGTPKFKLRPDILIRQDARTLVLDTKWKAIVGSGPDAVAGVGNYGIEQADLYQLYAYGKKYGAEDLFLIYPANETFCEPLSVFGYDATTRLHVVPFDVLMPPANEVEKLAQYALSFGNCF